MFLPELCASGTKNQPCASFYRDYMSRKGQYIGGIAVKHFQVEIFSNFVKLI
jgi:hypothetical protein